MRKRLFALLTFLIAGAVYAADPAGYLFVTFRGEATPLTEQVYFMVSENGRAWNALNNGEPVLVSTVGERGVCDPNGAKFRPPDLV